jgi:magnesium chelatase subunit I
MSNSYSEVKTLGQLKESDWQSVSVKEEMRSNLIKKLQDDVPLFPDILGYEHSVIPQLQHALLSKHDVILLGLRGQAKTRMLRLMVNFLDEYMPVVEGSEINDDPLNPVSKYARELVDEQGDETPVAWVHRSKRYGEKLATPDTTVADLIGDLDPIKAATQKRTLADENVINFGLIPRTNRGIFAINELPDLQPRIQVALLNIMQERDIQIRGFDVRIPLDVAMVFSANPEDYTNRGNIITPLKDRIDSQIMTHYPKHIGIGMNITEQEAWSSRNGTAVKVPTIIKEIIEQTAFEARDSEYIDQKSGVSARLTITAMEQLVSSAERRAIVNGETETVARVTDLFHIVPALTGKLELVYEGEQEGALNVVRHIVGKAIKNRFVQHFPDPQKQKKQEEDNVYEPILNWFASGNELELTDKMSDSEYANALNSVEGLEDLVSKHSAKISSSEKLIMMDVVVEALHQHSMLGKEDVKNVRSYTDMLGSMLGSVGGLDDLDDLDQ